MYQYTELDGPKPREGRDRNEDSTSLNSGIATSLEPKTVAIKVSQNPVGHPEAPAVAGGYGVTALEWYTESKARKQKFPSVTRFSFSSLLLGNTKINNKPTSGPGIVCVLPFLFFN